MNGHIEARTSKRTGRTTYRGRIHVGKRNAERYGIEAGGYDTAWCERRRAKPGCESAEQALEDLICKLTGQVPERSPLTVSEIVAVYRTEHLPQLRPLSRVNYARILDNFILPAFGACQAEAVTTADVSVWLAGLSRDGRLDGRGGMAPKYVRQCRFVLCTVYAHAVETERITRNPVTAAKGPAVPTRDCAPPTVAQIRAALTALEGTRYHVPAALAAGTGMRRGEVLGLSWSHVDLASGIVSVRRQLIEVPGEGVSFARLKTDAARRDLELPQFAIDALTAEWARQHDLAGLRGHTWTAEALVCPNHDGCPIPPDKFSRGFTAVLVRRGLAPFRFHDLRHAVATDLLAGGMRADAVQRQLGHTSVSITLGVYAHARPSDRRQVAEALDGIHEKASPQEVQPEPEQVAACGSGAQTEPESANVLDLGAARSRRLPA